MTLTELARFIGCHLRMIQRLVSALGIQPTRGSEKRRLYSLKSAQIRRIILEYNRRRDGKGHAAGQMRRRNLSLAGAERLERYWIWRRQVDRERAEKQRNAARAARVAGLAAKAAAVRGTAMGGGAIGEAFQSAPQAPADGAPADAESSGDLPFRG